MLKTNTSISNTISLISLAIVLVIALGAVANVKLATGTPNRELSALDQPTKSANPDNVMHSDLYWSPLDECSNAGLIDGTDCRQANLPSMQSSIDLTKEMTTLRTNSRQKPDQPFADAPQVNENHSYTVVSNIAKSKHDVVNTIIANVK